MPTKPAADFGLDRDVEAHRTLASAAGPEAAMVWHDLYGDRCLACFRIEGPEWPYLLVARTEAGRVTREAVVDMLEPSPFEGGDLRVLKALRLHAPDWTTAWVGPGPVGHAAALVRRTVAGSEWAFVRLPSTLHYAEADVVVGIAR